MTNEELEVLKERYLRDELDHSDFIELLSSLKDIDIKNLKLEEDKVKANELTLKEVQDKLANTKVFVSDKSKEIQKKLFSLGYRWQNNGDKICHLDTPFIYIKGHSVLNYGNSFKMYMEDSRTEISIEDILSINLKKLKHTFKPLERVLVRDYDNGYWYPELFFDYRNDKNHHPYLCIANSWEQCIPYKGNEDLLGTTLNPKE